MGSKEQKLIKAIVDVKFLDHFRNQNINLNDLDSTITYLNLRKFFDSNDNVDFLFAENGIKATCDEIKTFLKDKDSRLPQFKEKSCPKYKYHPYYNFSELKEAYLLLLTSFNDQQIEKIRVNHGIFITNSDQYLNDWAKLNILPRGYGDEIIDENFKWEIIGNYAYCCDHIVMQMPYLSTWFKNVLYDNFSYLINAVLGEEKGVKKHLLIFTWYDQLENQNKKGRLTLKQFYEEINQILKGKNIELSLIGFDEKAFKTTYPNNYFEQLNFIKEVIHPRYIFTNYRFYNSDAEWNYDRNGRFVHTGQIHVLSNITEIQNRVAQLSKIRELKELLFSKPFSDFTYVYGNSSANRLIEN